MRRFHYYDVTSGLIADFVAFVADEETAKANAPPGHEMIEGEFNHLSQRIDLTGGKPQPVEYQSPLAAAAEAENKRMAIQAEIARLQLQQHDFVRQFIIGRGGADELREIDDAIEALRASLTGPSAATAAHAEQAGQSVQPATDGGPVR